MRLGHAASDYYFHNSGHDSSVNSLKTRTADASRGLAERELHPSRPYCVIRRTCFALGHSLVSSLPDASVLEVYDRWIDDGVLLDVPRTLQHFLSDVGNAQCTLSPRHIARALQGLRRYGLARAMCNFGDLETDNR